HKLSKGVWRMPRLSEAMKDATSCDKPRGSAHTNRSADFRMGQPTILKIWYPKGGETGELKHLSTRRKRKQISDSVSSGERTRISPNHAVYGLYGVVGPRYSGMF